MIRKLIYFFCCMLPYLALAQVQMSPAEVSAFKKSLQKAKEIKTLETDFVQYKHMSFIKKPVESTGKLYVQHPDRLSWSYTSPFAYKMVFKAGKVLINDQGKRQSIDVSNSKQFEKISHLVSSAIRGEEYNEKEFAVSYLKEAGGSTIKLVPKTTDTKRYIKEISLLFSGSDNLVREIILREPSGDYTRFVLKNRKINTKLHDSVFNF
ncbi:outer membrane lipoprotein carrier protein [Sphingobacterium allocomposti]|uniref:Outer membrane lipoprotein carrier protein n=1 Tax=Sphingobacterium allocomposti TaxID=415956 RepID=A0A5S5DJU1_9SPHI|nr:outer membrane lipoprotein carrier protein LolA [Sphingobacterium composti Yoo et al. 2007 non Ten et al. 2007]TYP95945.1 outer membrane lipoprotein carrier protein [Sphingobacterium composti Yoo et al. 2007 non Ten et al. 2007]HLS96491.1 outer membrane lipoprotein carrier protein LolA [Sphingobacterium sp.]